MQEIKLEDLDMVFGGLDLDKTPDNGPARPPHGGGNKNGGWPELKADRERYV